MNLDELRNKIDSLDDRIAESYAERLKVAGKIGELKRIERIDITDVGRENKIIERLTDGKDPKTA